ncbi:MAG: ATP-binding protein, partial [Thermoplasmata archaeon]|nr:ATP-binding protein [Thermoplasmata archaeon]
MASSRGKLVEESLFQPEMVGRERELEKLTKRLDEALEGKGSTVFISGEAGIGKTRLVEELKTVSQSKGFHILSGHSMYESLTPYMPFLEALKSGGLEYLFAEEAPRVEGVYLVTDTGLLIKEVVRQETELNPDIFASMLKTVGDFVRKSLSLLDDSKDSGSLSRLSHGDSTILIEGGESANLAVVISGRENEFLIDGMRETVAKVHKFCGNALREWDGDDESVQGVDRLLQRLITSGKYDGVYYGSDDPSARRNLLFENVCLGLTRQTQASPILLCVEDLQWADPSTLALMHYVAREAPKCSLLITGTYRPEDLGTRMGETHQLVKALE